MEKGKKGKGEKKVWLEYIPPCHVGKKKGDKTFEEKREGGKKKKKKKKGVFANNGTLLSSSPSPPTNGGKEEEIKDEMMEKEEKEGRGKKEFVMTDAMLRSQRPISWTEEKGGKENTKKGARGEKKGGKRGMRGKR